jgi:hypothetical protein
MLKISINMVQEMAAKTCLPTSPVSITISCGKCLAFNSISNRMLAGTRREIQQIELHPIRRGPTICKIKESNSGQCAKAKPMQRTSGRIARIAKVKPMIRQSLMILKLNSAKAQLTVSRLLGCSILVMELGIMFEIFNGKSSKWI